MIYLLLFGVKTEQQQVNSLDIEQTHEREAETSKQMRPQSLDTPTSILGKTGSTTLRLCCSISAES